MLCPLSQKLQNSCTYSDPQLDSGTVFNTFLGGIYVSIYLGVYIYIYIYANLLNELLPQRLLWM